MRHGQASFETETDFERPLDRIGIEQVNSASQIFSYQPQKIIVSPYLRAQQTLQIFNEKRNIVVEQSKLVTPEADIKSLIDFLTMREESSLMIIGHNPLLSYLANMLTGQDQFALGTASIVHLQGEIIASGCMTLKKEYNQ
ncbi:phosphohistidine phosphatase [Marinicellulosiphila megalodicopiae]